MRDETKPGRFGTGVCVSRTLRFYIKVTALKEALLDESGQDLVEYALVAALVALGATAAIQGFAANITTGFGSLGTKLTTYTS